MTRTRTPRRLRTTVSCSDAEWAAIVASAERAKRNATDHIVACALAGERGPPGATREHFEAVAALVDAVLAPLPATTATLGEMVEFVAWGESWRQNRPTLDELDDVREP